MFSMELEAAQYTADRIGRHFTRFAEILENLKTLDGYSDVSEEIKAKIDECIAEIAKINVDKFNIR